MDDKPKVKLTLAELPPSSLSGDTKVPKVHDLRRKYILERLKPMAKSEEWNPVQDILHEIEATFVIENKKLNSTLLGKLILEEIDSRYKDDPDMAAILKELVPTSRTLIEWRSSQAWKDAVWTQVKGEGMFTADRRAQVINKLFEQATEKGSVNAAKVYLTLSGDYTEKASAEKDKDIDTYREIQKALLKR